ncbi:HAMP domain-containing sensor histidine kinase [Alteromonadaceae bacterium BrNp21-10]|nr:HAMP domain-containing sensor histidine kinase [Alteromonadaceae bacterium BrNp21-10]
MRLGSLKQLTLCSFIIALMPLAVLLWQNQQTLTELGDLAVSQARQAVDITRSVESLQSNGVDLERLIRQYRIVKTDDLLPLMSNIGDSFKLALRASCDKRDLLSQCQNVEKQFNQLSVTNRNFTDEQLDQQLVAFRGVLKDFATSSATQLDHSLHAQKQYVQDVQFHITWQTLVLVSITLMLVWAAGHVVLKPIVHLQALIRAIGDQNQSLPDSGFGYPREFVDLDTRLRWLAKRLNHLEELRLSMLRHASHELKTPLASIREGCSLLSEQVVGPLNSKQAEVLSLLEVSAKRLTQLVEQLLDYNRLLQDANPKLQRFDLCPLVDNVAQQHRLALQQNSQQLRQKIEVSEIYADPVLLQRILDNLINNAIAYGKGNSTVTLKAKIVQGKLFIDVENHCETKPQLDNRSLFLPFQRGNQQRQDGLMGSGLGLSVVDECARIMKGKASIVAEADKLFHVRVMIPQVEDTQ